MAFLDGGNIFGYSGRATYNGSRYSDSTGGVFLPQRYQIPAEEVGYFAPRYGLSIEEIGYFAPRYGTENHIGHFAPRYAVNQEYLGYFEPRYEVLPPEAFTTIAIGDLASGTAIDPLTLASRYGVNHAGKPVLPSVTGSVAGTDPCRSNPFTLTLRQSGPSEMTIDVPNSQAIHPDLTSSPLLAQPVYVDVAFAQDNLTWTGKSYSWGDTEAPGHWISMSWGATDLVHYLLTVEDQEMPSVVSSKTGGVVMMKSVVREICQQYGVPVSILTEDYPVPVFNRQGGRPLEWIADLIEPLMAEYRVEDGNKLVIYVPGETGAKNWAFDSNLGVMPSRTSSTSLGSVYNSVRMVRTVNAGKRSTTTPYEVYAFQEYTFTFDEPLYAVTHQVLAANSGVFDDIRLRDEQGNIVRVRNIPPEKNYPTNITAADAANRIKSVTLRWRAASIEVQNAGITGGHGSILFRGTALQNEDTAFGEFSSNFTVTDSDPTSIALYGTRFRELRPSPLIPNQTIAALYASRWLKFVGAPRRDFTFQVPFMPRMQPGHRVTWDNHRLNSIHNLTITSVQHGPLADDLRPLTQFTAYELL